MNNTIGVKSWVLDVLANDEKFTFGEVCYALDAKTKEERGRVSRNLSYLAQTGIIKRLGRGVFKNLNYRKEFSGHLGEIGFNCYPKNGNEDGETASDRFIKMKHIYAEDGFVFERQNLWKYKGASALLFKAYNPTGNTDYLFDTQYLLLIREDDPKRKKVIRYVGRKAEGISMFVYQDGNERGDIHHLFPNVPWLF